ncbi:hypothetical protein Q4Q34_11250 [Flavivirga abyssicola]|uniref:hypothetical protein n=1 Tax=Flavivirga abyssicola TaxID=3063533 RepID=UPI0026E102E8|nr:hypothetical protein [Flavivirga sp. MEBiC07777]WVK11801.1 hypothetical protein Q4Q34_11250 [Flavivirga sp. MEBiC07777]
MSKSKIFIPCDDANHVCDKTQYKEASLLEMIKLNIHLLYCRACRKYTKNNTKLTKAIKSSEVECLDKRNKESMRLDFEKALKELTD